jgi:hypothetical protein
MAEQTRIDDLRLVRTLEPEDDPHCWLPGFINYVEDHYNIVSGKDLAEAAAKLTLSQRQAKNRLCSAAARRHNRVVQVGRER